MLIMGAVTVSQGMTFSTPNQFNVADATASITVEVTSVPAGATSLTIPIATFGELVGTLAFINVTFSATGNKRVAVVDACTELGPATQVSTATTLSVVVAVNTAPSCTSSSTPAPGGLSTGAIIGIAVGCGVAAILAVVVLVLILRYRRQQRTQLMTSEIHARELDRMK